jgi:poly-gamma-glutamate capsule biosynthesis protein CapA/YwtB (metallophosphatase superfamily)
MNETIKDQPTSSLADSQPEPSTPVVPDEKPLRLLLLGDCMLGRLVNDVLETQPSEYPWGNTIPILQSADWRLCNLECVISDRGEPWSAYPKAFHFRSAAKNIASLNTAGINAVSIANNHVLDYGFEAMFEMVEILDHAGIIHSGAGANAEESSKLATAVVQGQKIGLLAFTDNEPEWEAHAQAPGVFYVPTDLRDSRAKYLLSRIQEYKKVSGFLIVSAHWGSNWGYEPPGEHFAFAHAMVDAGADLIFGHSSHVFRGIELYKDRVILYGAGNFVDDYAVDKIERNDQSFIFLMELQDTLVRKIRLYPTLIRRCHALRADGIYARIITDKMNSLCAALGAQAVWDQSQGCLEIECRAREESKTKQIVGAV